MRHKFGNPYPTFCEHILSVTGPLDLGLPTDVKKKLDDKKLARNFDHRELNELLEKAILKPLSKLIGTEIADLVFGSFCDMLQEYKNIVAYISADGVTREELIPILLNGFYKRHLGNLLLKLHDKYEGPSLVTLFINADRAVDVTLRWIEQNEAGWLGYILSLTKDQKEMFSDWKKGQRLPSSQSISTLHTLNSIEGFNEEDWNRVKLLLLLSRAIDELKREYDKAELVDDLRCYIWGASDEVNIERAIEEVQISFCNRLAPELPLIAELQHKLQRTNIKQKGDIARFRSLLDQASKLIPDENYWLTWHDARWHVLSGDLVKAKDLYKKAFNNCLFSAGENQKYIIEEALPVAASIEKRDLVFLKELKRACVTFGYDIPSIYSGKFSNKASTLIEDWEYELWENSFSTVFPKRGLFPECEKHPTNSRVSNVIDGSVKKVPCLKSPNKKVRYGANSGKKMPQLVWFMLEHDYDAVEKLMIEGGASVNVKSDSGDTPIQVALEILNVPEFDIAKDFKVVHRSLDDRFFDLISKYPHSIDIINSRTQKRRLLPIILAVETGRPDIVRKVLDMGADPNGRGQTDEQTPLNVCLKYIARVKQPALSTQQQKDIPQTPEVLDSVRRHLNGLSGFTLEQQKAFHEITKIDPRFLEIQEQILKAIERRITEKMSLDSLRKIAKMLIEQGADVNAEHRSPVLGYTPLMLAAELDERDLFDLMLSNGGDLTRIYTDARTHKEVDCWDIAQYFNSHRVLASLDYVKHYFVRQ